MFIGISLAISQPRPSAYDSAANALFARFTTPPTAQRAQLINALILSLKTGGVWAKLDAFYMIAAADAQAAQRNWVADAYNLSPQSAPVFEADRGYTGNGTSSYLDTVFNPATAVSPKFVQNSAHVSFYSRTDAATDNVDMGNTNTLLQMRNSSNQAGHRVNAASSVGVVVASGIGHVLSSRTGALAADDVLYKSGSSIGTGAASAAPSNSPIYILGRGGVASFSARQCSSASIGGGLTAGEALAFYNALNAYLVAVGAA